jgi:hypothetical protein
MGYVKIAAKIVLFINTIPEAPLRVGPFPLPRYPGSRSWT